MNAVFTVRCYSCQAEGPVLRRTAGGTALYPSSDPEVPGWEDFLPSRPFHDLWLDGPR